MVPICRKCSKNLTCAPSSVVRSILNQDTAEADLIVTGERLAIAHALWCYDPESPARVFQHLLKYRGHQKLSVILGQILAHRLRKREPLAGEFDMIVPVPLHRIRLLERGYNQARGIASGISEILRIPVSEYALKRETLSRSQIRSGRDDREANLENAFSPATGDSLKGKNVLLVDDVITTGATLRSALTTLRDARTCEVGVAVLFAVTPEN